MLCRSAVRWLYRLDHSYSWESPYPQERDWAFQDKKGHTRLLITTEGVITVTRGYAWDGCTPKLCVFDLLVGTPDGAVHAKTGRPKTYYASLIHDALYQFLPDGLPMTRAQADRCFLILMRESDFMLSGLYYWAVRLGGWLTLPLTRSIRGTAGRSVDVTAALEASAGGLTSA
jgi:hypothetical protein